MRDRRSCRGRPARSGEAARQAGLAARAALHLVSTNVRHLADGVDGKVPATRIARVCVTPSLARWEIGVEVWLEGERRNDLRLGVTLRNRDRVLAADSYLIVNDEVHRGIALSDPGIDDSRNELLWSPHAPNLIAIEFQVLSSRGELIESVHSYTALRTATVQGDRFLLKAVRICSAWCSTRATGPTAASPRPTTPHCAASSCAYAKRMAVGMAYVALAHAPLFISWRPGNNHVVLERPFVKGINLGG